MCRCRARRYATLLLVPMSRVSASPAIHRVLDLLDPTRHDAAPELHDGYLDLLQGVGATGSHPGQRWMESRTLPLIYERLWRPLGALMLMGATGPGMPGEYRIARKMLAPTAGERVLDVGCGPGNFTRNFARDAGDGLVVGLDASRTMIERAVQQTSAANVVYVLGDASLLPFRDAELRRDLLLRRAVSDRAPHGRLGRDRSCARTRWAGRAASQLQPRSSTRGNRQSARETTHRCARIRS